MTRTIKFRAYDKVKKEWLLGYEYPNLGGFSMFGEMMMMGEYANLLSEYFPDRLKDIELMQYTGLLDKNGVEIYEGDILSVDQRKCAVVWDQGNLQWVVKFDLSTPTPFKLPSFNSDLELWYVVEDGPDTFIIGNLYETPSLLINN